MSKIYLHVGHGKTGTSFLQSIFAKNAETLAQNNIVYSGNARVLETAAKGNTTSGNKLELFAKLKEDKPFADDPRSYLFSAESLFASFQDEDFVQSCVAASGASGKQISVLLFVRDPIDFQLSTYTQGAQGRDFNYDVETHFQSHATRNQTHMFDAVKTVCSACETHGFELSVFNYTHHKRDLVAITAKFLDLDTDKVTLEVPNKRVNRSLGAMELGVSRAMRKMFASYRTPRNENYLKAFADATSNVKWPPLAASQANVDAFSASIKADMKAVNDVLPSKAHYQLAPPSPPSRSDAPSEEYGVMLATQIVQSTLQVMGLNLLSDDKMDVMDRIFLADGPQLPYIRQYANWLFSEQAFDRAVVAFHALIEIEPEVGHYFKLARCYRKIGQLENSIEQAMLGFESDPTFAPNAIFLVDRLLENKQKTKTIPVLETLRANDLEPGVVEFIEYKVAMANKNKATALRAITAAADLNPENKRYKAALEKLTAS